MGRAPGGTHDQKSAILSLSAAPISRRGLIVSAGAAGLAAAARPYGAFAAGPEATLKVGFISPRTGTLGGFGETDGYILELARKALARASRSATRPTGSRSSTATRQSDPSRAGQLAKTLINSDKIDMMLVVSTPEVINPVADACEAAGVPCLSTVMPWEAWYFGRGAKPGQPSPFKWTYHFGFGGGEFLQDLCLAVEPDRDQQEGRRALSQRRRRQRHPRESRARARQGTASRSSIRAPTKTARPTIRPRSPSSRPRNARSSTPSRSRPTSPPSGARPRSRATRRWSRSRRSPRPACSPPK